MKNYDNFFLGVNNLDDAKEYYESILGLKLKFDFSKKGMIAFNVGNRLGITDYKKINM